MKKMGIDLTGRKFGRLTVVCEAERDKNGVRRWVCSCECGNEKVIYQNALNQNKTKSCGCYLSEASRNRMSLGYNSIFTKEYLLKEHKEKDRSLREIAKEHGCTLGCITRYMRKFEIEANDPFYALAGHKIEMLTVFDMAYTKDGSSYWNVKCDCGNTKVVKGASLVRRAIVSCGCWNKEKCWEGVGDLSKTYWRRLVKHATERGLAFEIDIHHAWKIFESQKGKCALSNESIVLDRSYSDSYKKTETKQTASLDRIDSTKGYIQGNVQWVHKRINSMKSNLTDGDFIEWCKKVANHNIT